MTRDEVFAALAAERLELADLFESLTPAQLATPSLCEGWTVKHVAGHLTTLFNYSIPSLAFRALTEQLSFDRVMKRVAEQMVLRPIEGIVAQLRDYAHDRRHPPGRPVAPLADAIVHGEDVRRPLGLHRDVPFDRASVCMEFVTGGRALGFLPGSRVRGLRFVATDGDGSWGQGAIVHGPVMSLLLGVMGRRVALAELGGAVGLLEQRLPAPDNAAKPAR